MGYDVLPDIHWHKPTNAPNKFMGSGMYPPCAYVTYELNIYLYSEKAKTENLQIMRKLQDIIVLIFGKKEMSGSLIFGSLKVLLKK